MADNVNTFSRFKLNKQILKAIAQAGYTAPTPIQCQAIPLIQAGHDVVGIAQTGTGKTAAFVLPLLMKLKYTQGVAPRALILVPTRELALQISMNVLKYATYLDLKCVVLFGGTGMQAQAQALAEGCDMIVATPGRYMDLYRKAAFHNKCIHTLVIDEADKMMDMGFMPQIRKILEIIPVKRQNLLFSATMSAVVENLSYEFLEFPERVEVTPQATTATTVSQVRYDVPNFKTKVNLVGHLLEMSAFTRVILFVKTKANADNLFKFISRKSTRLVKVIHGNKAQNTRLNAIETFKNGQTDILVATDVAARGLDVSKVSHVINFDVPPIYADYVHRIGRTGRANRLGKAITFVNQAESYHIAQIEKLIGKSIKHLALPQGVVIEPTPFAEQQQMLKAIDLRRMKAEPNYKGAFHEKKPRKPKVQTKQKNRKKRAN